MISKVREITIPLAVPFKNSSLRANDVRFDLVIERWDLGQPLVIGLTCGRGLYYQICRPLWVTRRRGVVVIKENNLFSSR